MNYQLKELIYSNKLQNLLNDLSEELAIAVSIIDTDSKTPNLCPYELQRH